jgi:hypothetical protein
MTTDREACFAISAFFLAIALIIVVAWHLEYVNEQKASLKLSVACSSPRFQTYIPRKPPKPCPVGKACI